jgi:hypothetical protein
VNAQRTATANRATVITLKKPVNVTIETEKVYVPLALTPARTLRTYMNFQHGQHDRESNGPAERDDCYSRSS